MSLVPCTYQRSIFPIMMWISQAICTFTCQSVTLAKTKLLVKRKRVYTCTFCFKYNYLKYFMSYSAFAALLAAAISLSASRYFFS